MHIRTVFPTPIGFEKLEGDWLELAPGTVEAGGGAQLVHVEVHVGQHLGKYGAS